MTFNAQVPTLTAEPTSIIHLLDNRTEINVGKFNIGACTENTYIQVNYRFDDGDDQVYSANIQCTNESRELPSFQIPKAQLTNKPEHKLTVWLTDSESNYSDKVEQEILVTESSSYIDYNDNNNLLSLKGARFPVGSQLVSTKVTDQDIIDKVGTSNAYKVEFISNGKSYSYYKNKYGVDSSINFGELTLPSGLTKNIFVFK